MNHERNGEGRRRNGVEVNVGVWACGRAVIGGAKNIQQQGFAGGHPPNY